MRCLWAILLFTVSAWAQAHEVHADVAEAPVKIVTLRYADGEPFSYEEYEIRAEGKTVPVQKGRTDEQGRIAVLPVPGKKLALKASSEDGHGVSLTIDESGSSGEPVATRELPRKLLILCGVSFIFGCFGLWQLFLRSRQRQQS